MKRFCLHAFSAALPALLLLSAAAVPAHAQKPAGDSAWQTVQSLTRDIVNGARAVKKGREHVFFQRVERQLQTAIDFESFARGVMGQYASAAHRDSLSPQQRQHLDRQIGTFAQVFRKQLVQAYGNAFLAVADVIRVETVKPKKASSANTEVVVQKLYGLGDNPFTIYYQMKRRDGAWRLHNIAIEKLNLGKLYRTQFQAAVAQHAGDLDRVIADWDTQGETGKVSTPVNAKK